MMHGERDSSTTASYLWVAAETGYLTSDRWRQLADDLILRQGETESWVLEVSTAGGCAEISEVLKNVVWSRGDELWAGAGYAYLRFQRGDFDCQEMLRQCGCYCDSGWGMCDCEEFFVVGTDLRNGRINQEEAMAAARLAVEGSLKWAQEQLAALETYFGQPLIDTTAT